jgi:two-component system response regulator CpxR
MPVITIFSGAYCGGEEVARTVADRRGYELITDDEIIARASRSQGTAESKFERALFSRASVFNKFTHEKERCVAFFKSALPDLLSKDGRVFLGYAGHLVPRSITHVLKVCLIADRSYRLARAIESEKVTKSQAIKLIAKDDERSTDWTEYLLHKEPWNPVLYDIVQPMDKTNIEQTVSLIIENTTKPVLQPSDTSVKAVRDFALTAAVEMVLAGEGHAVTVTADEGRIVLTINKHVIMLTRLEEELRKIARAVPGVKEVETRVGPDFYRTDIYRKYDFETPSKVLLVDDEQEFVQTLSERLLMRDVGSAIAYNGEQALSVIDEDEPEVMILDLKMPGIDGIEVLRRVKETHPNVEVIILTGHGSKEDEQTCMDLGAFAYLRKPVDIELLTKTMNEAYARIRSGPGRTR